MYNILIVDDEENIVNALKRCLKKIGDWNVQTFTSAAGAESSSFDLFISDYRMPEMNGVEFLIKVKDIQPNAVRIILSGYTDLEALVSAINEAEIFRFIHKPWNDYELILTIEQSLKYKEIMTENIFLANQVRSQSKELSKNQKLLSKLEKESPGITHVNWNEDGSIVIEDDE